MTAVANAFWSGSVHDAAAERIVTGLTKARVASRKASSSPKNSVKATRTPVTAAKRRKSAAGKPIHRCHLRKKAGFTRCKLRYWFMSVGPVHPNSHLPAAEGSRRDPLRFLG